MTPKRAWLWVTLAILWVGAWVVTMEAMKDDCPAEAQSEPHRLQADVTQDGSLEIRHYEVRDNVHCFVATQGGLGIAISCLKTEVTP